MPCPGTQVSSWCCKVPLVVHHTDVAVLAEYPAEDPLHRAADVAAGLRLRCRVRINLAAGRCSRLDAQLPPGLACVERRQHAAIERKESSLELHVRALSGASLHRWPLPQLRAAPPSCWRWGSTALAVPYEASSEGGSAGVLLVDTSSGSCKCVPLPFAAADAYRLSPFISNWSSSGLLLAQHNSEDRVPWISVLDYAGHVVAAAPRPEHELTGQAAVIEQGTFAPDGQHAYIFVPDSCDFWVWGLSSTLPCLVTLPDRCYLCSLLWSFDSSRLLCFDSDRGCAYLWSDGTSSESPPADVPTAALWGSKDRVLLVLDDSKGASPHSYRAQDTLCEVRVLTTDTCRADFTESYSAALSADGGLAAVPAAPLQGPGELTCVAVMNMGGHLLQLVCVGFPAGCLSWSSDSARLLVSNLAGSRLVLLDFAAG